MPSIVMLAVVLFALALSPAAAQTSKNPGLDWPTKPITLDITLNGGRMDARTQKYKVGFTATGTVMQADWGMNGPGSVANGVKLEINAEFSQK